MFLCTYHLVYIITTLLIIALPLLVPSINSWAIFTKCVPYLLTIAHIAMTGIYTMLAIIATASAILGSIYTTVCIGIERYITVCHPYYKLAHNWGAKRYIIPIAMLALFYNSAKLRELEVKEVDIEGDKLNTSYFLTASDMR